jgi:glucosylceramidase
MRVPRLRFLSRSWLNKKCLRKHKSRDKLGDRKGGTALKVLAYRTAMNTGERLGAVEARPLGAEPLKLDLRPELRFQTVRGFGGAFTEAGGWVLSRLSAAKQEQVLRGYFDPVTGLGYSLCRSHINSCDFCLDNYSCCDAPGDTTLSSFNLLRDEKWLLPFIKKALAVPGAAFELMVTPWSPPAWMKTNESMNGGGRLRNDCREVWAHFLARFVREYRARGIPVTMASVQNEPEACQKWDSCLWTAAEEGEFVAEFLGPVFRQENLGDMDLLIWEHNRDAMVRRAVQTIGFPGAARYIHGTSYHWYNGEGFENVSRVHELFPEKHLYFTEGCIEHPSRIGGWSQGEHYAHQVINDMNNWCEGWIDWNLLLSSEGGPNHAGNFCDAPVMADVSTGEITFQSSYWYLGHFSRFVRPGFIKIGCNVCGNITPAATGSPGVEATAFSGGGADMVAIVMNRTDRPYDLRISAAGEAADAALPERSISTFLVGKTGRRPVAEFS